MNEQFEFRDPRNKLVGELGDDSQFEVSINHVDCSDATCWARLRPSVWAGGAVGTAQLAAVRVLLLCCNITKCSSMCRPACDISTRVLGVLCYAGLDILGVDWSFLCGRGSV